MLAKPKCIVLKALEQGKILTDEMLQSLATSIPLATKCVECVSRKENTLTKFCDK